MTSNSPRLGASLPRAARPLVALFLALTGATCTDRNPTSPLLSPDDPRMSTAAGLTVSPAVDTALIGGTIPLSVSGLTGGRSAAWTSSDTTIATAASSGVATANVTGRAAGVVTITASSNGKSGTASVRVIPVPVRSITVTPDPVRVQRGEQTQLTATPRDSAGAPLAGRPVVWSVDSASIASVSPTGLATAIARGTAHLRATAEGVTGQASFTVVVPELSVTTLAAPDSANAGDTINVIYTVTNSADAPIADSVIVRVGLWSGVTNTIISAVRRRLPRITTTMVDTARIAIPVGGTSNGLTVMTYADCSDQSSTNEARLANCLARPDSAGTITEAFENNNSRTAFVTLRAPNLAVTTFVNPDSAWTRTIDTLAITIANSGSATPTGFDVIAGLYDATTSTVMAATTVATPVMSSRATRALSATVAIPAGLDPSHSYQMRVAVDCFNGGATPAAKLQACIAIPGGSGAVAESNESDNGASHTVIVSSNVARVVAQPDSIVFTAIGDTASISAAGYDRAGAIVLGVTMQWSSLDSAVSVSATGAVQAVRNGSARIVASGEGHADTTTVVVAQQAVHVAIAPDSVLLVSVGDTAHFTAAATDRLGAAMSPASIVWGSLDPTIASVDVSGTARALASGRARIVASSGAAADTSIVIINLGASSVTVTPDTSLVSVGATVTLAAELRDARGNVSTAWTPAWTSLDPSVATVSDVGLVTTTSAGVARIVAARDGHADTAVVLVNPTGYTHRWIGANALGWSQGANWYPHVVPSATDNPYIAAGTPQRPYLTVDATVGSIGVAAGSGLVLRNHNLFVNGPVDAAGPIDSGTVELRGAGTMSGTLPNVTVRRPVALAGRTTTKGIAVVDSSRVTLDGHTLVASSIGVRDRAAVVETNPLDTLWVTGGAVFSSSTLSPMSAGVLRLDYSLSQVGAPGNFAPTGSHTTVATGVNGQQFTFDDTTVTFQNLFVVANQGQVAASQMTVRGVLRVTNGASLSVGTLHILSQMPDVAQGRYDVSLTSINGPVTLDRNFVSSNTVRVERGGSLTLNGHRLDVVSFGVGQGTLTMNSDADTLLIRMSAGLYGRELLSGGTLIAQNLRVSDAYFPGASLDATGSHTTVLTGTVAQQLWLPVGPTAHFANVRIDNGADIEIDGGGLDIRGQLQSSGTGVLRDPSGYVVNVSGGLDVNGLVFDAAPLNVTGGTLTRFDNVTFRNFAATYPGQLRIRHAGTGVPFTMNNINFLSDASGGGLWIDADDTDSTTGALTLDVTSPQWTSGPARTSAGSATVTWRTP